MTVTIELWKLVAAMGIPSAVTGFAFWMLKRWIEKKEKARNDQALELEKKRNAQEDARTEISIAMVAAINAAIALGEATATAVSRIPDAHCNGDMHDALEYAKSVKNAQKDLLIRVGIKSINETDHA